VRVRDTPRALSRVRRAGVRSVRAGAALFTSTSADWYTPPAVIARVRAVLGAIDLDPAADEERRVPAADDGLAHDWPGRVFLNPPYGRAIGGWVRHLVDQYRAGITSAAIVLLPARIGTAWWRPLAGYPVCFVRGRLRFSGRRCGAPFPSALVYLGADASGFAEQFAAIADHMTPSGLYYKRRIRLCGAIRGDRAPLRAGRGGGVAGSVSDPRAVWTDRDRGTLPHARAPGSRAEGCA
jgi:hypothetical protein